MMTDWICQLKQWPN